MIRDTAWLLLARLVSAGTTIVLLAAISRTFGSDAVGAVSLGLALGAIAAMAVDLGTSALLVREAARDQGARHTLFGAFLVARLVTVPIGVAAVAGIAIVIVPSAPWLVTIAAAGVIVQQAGELTRSVFVSQQRMKVPALHSIAENLLWLLAIAAVARLSGDVEAAFAVGLLVMVGSVGAGIVLASTIGHAAPRLPPLASSPGLARYAMPFAAASLISVALGRIDTVLVGALLPAGNLPATAAFFTSVRLIGALEYLPEILGRASFPRIAKAARDDPRVAASIMSSLARVLVLASLPWTVVLALAGPDVLVLALGPQFKSYGWLLPTLALALPARFLASLYGVGLTGGEGIGRRVAATAVALVVVVALDSLLIPSLGLIGAVIGSVTGPLALVVLFGSALRRLYGSLGESRFLALGATILAIAAIPALPLWLLGAELASMCVFAIVYTLIAVWVVARRARFAEFPT